MLASRGFPLGAKGRLYSACVCSVMLYGTETWSVKKEDVIGLENNDAKMVRWICNVRPEDKIRAEQTKDQTKIEEPEEMVTGYQNAIRLVI